MKFSGKVGNGPVNKRLNFGGDPDHGWSSRMDHGNLRMSLSPGLDYSSGWTVNTQRRNAAASSAESASFYIT